MELLRVMQYLIYTENKELKFKKVGNLISPDEKEVRLNNRSRSAKLRVAEKI